MIQVSKYNFQKVNLYGYSFNLLMRELAGLEIWCKVGLIWFKVVSIPRLGRSARVGNGNPLQYSCLEDSMDRGAWQATVQGVAKSQKQLHNTHTHTHTHTHKGI